MADHKLQLLLMFVVFACVLDSTYGYYCDSDRCTDLQYCCGMDICCDSYRVWNLWYFWTGIVFFMLLLMACGGFWHYRHQHEAILITTHTYSPMTNEKMPNQSDEFDVHAHGQRLYRQYLHDHNSDELRGTQAPPPYTDKYYGPSLGAPPSYSQTDNPGYIPEQKGFYRQ